MKQWLYRAVGAVGVASGALLLSNGVAHAQAANDAKPDLDPQAMRGLVAEFFTPMGQHREEIIGDLFSKGGPLGGITGGGGAGSLLGGITGGLTGGGGGSDLLSGLTGATGPLGGLTGGKGLSGITGTLTGKGDGGPLASLTGGQGLAGLTGSLTGKGPDGAKPLSGVTSSLTGTGDSSALSAVTSSLTGGLTGTGGGSPLSGVTSSLTGGLTGTGQRNPSGPAALRDSIGDTDGVAVNGQARGDIFSPSLRGSTLDTTAQRPIQLNPDVARQVNDAASPMVEALIADTVAMRLGIVMDAARGEENLPIVEALPLVSAIMGPEAPLKDLLSAGNFADGVPIVGDVLSGKLDRSAATELPVVRKLHDRGLLSNDSYADLPIIGSIPFLGDALSSLGEQTFGATIGTGKQNPLGDLLKGPGSGTRSVVPSGALPSGALAGDVSPSGATPSGVTLNNVPSLLPAAVSPTAPVPSPAGAEPALQTARSPIHVGRHRATERPEVADPELEATPAPGSLPLVGSLTGMVGSAMGGGVGTLPLSTLVRNMPLVNDVPLVGELGTPLRVLKALPLGGSLAGLVPVESDTAA